MYITHCPSPAPRYSSLRSQAPREAHAAARPWPLQRPWNGSDSVKSEEPVSKALVTSASLLVTRALLLVTRS